MQEEISAATAMLGLDGFVLLAVSQQNGELEQAIETTTSTDFCRGCGVQARLHNRRPTYVRDLPAGGRPVILVWVKRIWRCIEPRCSVVTWTETSEVIRPRASLTERARIEASRRVGQDGHSVAQVATEFAVAWATVMAAVVEYGAPLVDDPDRLAGVAALGVDETAFLAANGQHHTEFVTGMVDVTGSRLLDVVQGRSGTVLCQWINAQFRGYATALRTSLPHATRVLDPFHVTRLGFAAVDDVRRRVQQQDLEHRGRKGGSAVLDPPGPAPRA